MKKGTGGDMSVFGVNTTLNYTSSAPWLWGAGADFFNADKTAFATDTPAAQAALQFQADLALKHGAAPKPGERLGNGQNGNFNQQTLAMQVGWTTGTRNLLETADLEWDAVPMPKGAARSLSINWYNPLSITALSKQADAAWELVGHLTGRYVVKT